MRDGGGGAAHRGGEGWWLGGAGGGGVTAELAGALGLGWAGSRGQGREVGRAARRLAAGHQWWGQG